MNLYSVIIPAYNAEKYLEKCVDSVLNQTYKNCEIIIVNDGSKDQTPILCHKYDEIFDKVIVINQKNQGQLTARITGLGYASGNYVVFLDADDFWEENLLEVVDNYLNDYECDVVNFGANRILPNGVIDDTRPYYFSKRVDANDKAKFLKDFLVSATCNTMWSKIIKKEIAVKSIAQMKPYMHIRKGDDRLHSMFVYLSANTIGFIDKRLYNYRDNPNSLVNNVKLYYFKANSDVKYIVLKEFEKINLIDDELLYIYNYKYLRGILNMLISLHKYNYTEVKETIALVRNHPMYIQAINHYRIKDFSVIYK